MKHFCTAKMVASQKKKLGHFYFKRLNTISIFFLLTSVIGVTSNSQLAQLLNHYTIRDTRIYIYRYAFTQVLRKIRMWHKVNF